VGNTVVKIIGVYVVVRQFIPPTHYQLYLSTQLQMKAAKQPHQQLDAATSKTTTTAAIFRNTSLDSKPTTKDPPQSKAAEQLEAMMGRLDWSNAKTRDMGAAEAKEVKKKRGGRGRPGKKTRRRRRRSRPRQRRGRNKSPKTKTR
jgi:hypothetical protein